ncbi:hypothetical protein TIFTF001_038799 [Ficus carica]|uniref:Uncharacterized protein n=1 Tax=Ficus carica TaxID=3494 RepID=A0AA88EC77_FICCA|nr:hypothetical protein TIFTF001_038795 [Ficus carica]GMN69752.1 hypothetical protein TIFTF001_038799 [Ficus carica]
MRLKEIALALLGRWCQLDKNIALNARIAEMRKALEDLEKQRAGLQIPEFSAEHLASVNEVNSFCRLDENRSGSARM